MAQHAPISDASRERSRLHPGRAEDRNPTRLASRDIGSCSMHPWLLPTKSRVYLTEWAQVKDSLSPTLWKTACCQNSTPVRQTSRLLSFKSLPALTHLITWTAHLPNRSPMVKKEQRAKQTFYDNSGIKELQGPHPGDRVRIVPLKSQQSRQQKGLAEVERQVNIQSYKIRTEDGRVFGRSQPHLQLTKKAIKPEVDGPLPPPPKRQP